MKTLLALLSLFLPWPWRRAILERCFGYQIHPTARIRCAWVRPKRLIMEAGTEIGTFTICKNLDLIRMHAHSSIGRGNWITGFPSGPSPHFAHEQDRRPELILGEHAAITNRHLIDCTNRVTIGRFTTFAGFHSQILSHSIDLETCRQSSAPVTIGDFCFVGTNCVLLGGSALPSYSVLGAKSLLNKPFSETYSLYGGVPARHLKALAPEFHYFRRTVGMVI
jgi:acetyltransferase-like isoleucine patch superfamily enzyme